MPSYGFLHNTINVLIEIFIRYKYLSLIEINQNSIMYKNYNA